MVRLVLNIARLLLIVLPAVSPAAPAVFIRFDEYADGTRIEEQYGAQGVHFLNDYTAGATSWRANPTILATAASWSDPNVLVNAASDHEIWSSANVPLVIRFDQPIEGVGMRLGKPAGSPAVTATVWLLSDTGLLRQQRTTTPLDDFSSGIQIFDPTNSTRLVIIDYGNTSVEEAVDDLAFIPSSGTNADHTAPVVVIASPTQGLVANSPILLQGIVMDNSLAISAFTINGTAVKLTPHITSGTIQYEFNHAVTLVPGGNFFTAMAWDAAGNTGAANAVYYYGPPATVTLTKFHLTQRGIMMDKTADVDAPLVAGKFAIVRILLDARTALNIPTYVSSVLMRLYRRDAGGGADQFINDYWGTTHSPYLSSFNSSSQMAGIHFWIPGYDVDQPGDYRTEFQAYVGLTAVGAVMIPAVADQYFPFTRTYSPRFYILPVEAEMFAPDIGPDEVKQLYGAIDFVERTYPIADNSIDYVVAPALPAADGSAALDNAYDYIKGTGYEWTFKDAHASGLWRAQHEIVNFPGTAKPMAGRIVPGPLINLPRRSVYGYYNALGFAGGWDNVRYNFPRDDNHDGSIDDDMPNYAAEFFDQQTQQWSTNFATYTHGETFRSYVDQNRNSTYEEGEPTVAFARRGENARKYLIFGPAVKAMNALNDLILSGPKCTSAILWFPDYFTRTREDFGYPGGGQGSKPGNDVWVQPGPIGNMHVTGELVNGGVSTLAHEIGHNYNLADKYFGAWKESEVKVSPWAAYVRYQSVPILPDWSINSIMLGGYLPNRLYFVQSEYQALFDKLKAKAAPLAPRRAEVATALRIAGRVDERGAALLWLDAQLTSSGEFSIPDPDGSYSVRLGQESTLLAEFFFTPSRPSPPESQFDSRAGAAAAGLYPEFNLMVPFPAGTEWVQLTRSRRVLQSLERTPNAPVVTVLEPNGGETYGETGEMLIRWRARDDDGGRLLYSIQYSPDAGTRWFPIAAGLETTTFACNVAGLPGSSEAIVRVTASDGFNRGEDQSDMVFSIAPKPPRLAILQPAPGATFLQWEIIPLRAYAADLEDGRPAVFWTVESSVETLNLTGDMTRFQARTPGLHMIQASTTDRNGRSAQDQVVIFVQADSDQDGMSDDYETQHGFQIGNAQDAALDPDRDGLTNFDESWRGTDPSDSDSDNDGWSDGEEVAAGSNPLDPRSRPDTVTRAPGWMLYR
jgi:hypothetical protein